jgi:hypothetical protein
LIEQYHSEHLVGHVSRDSTEIEAREKVCAEAKEKIKEKKAAEIAKNPTLKNNSAIGSMETYSVSPCLTTKN